MNALKKYVDGKNKFRFLRDTDLIVIPKSNQHPAKRNALAAEIFDMLDCDLSPENLHCDGEISRAAAKRKEKAFNAAWKELETIIGRRFDSCELYS